jgi:hypothetical protein
VLISSATIPCPTARLKLGRLPIGPTTLTTKIDSNPTEQTSGTPPTSTPGVRCILCLFLSRLSMPSFASLLPISIGLWGCKPNVAQVLEEVARLLPPLVLEGGWNIALAMALLWKRSPVFPSVSHRDFHPKAWQIAFACAAV